jgi:NitT/TauT family transport system ATP-binding protein
VSVAFPGQTGTVNVLKDIEFSVERGEFVSIVGPSGCGKTTLLRTLSGFIQPNSGSIVQRGASGCLMVYQANSLFPWCDVLENTCFGLEAEGLSRTERERLAEPWLKRFGLEGREHAWPRELSTGMQQRVAVIRAFLSHAGLLLMDEPFAALDSSMRMSLQQDLLEIWEQKNKTVLFVTHDIEEAILLSDRVLVMSRRPASVIAEFRVPFDRPRDPELTLEDEFVDLKREIYSRLHDGAGARAHA